MSTTINFREYRKSDQSALAEIIRKTWKYDKMASPKTATELSIAYLNYCLTDQTFTQVAVIDDIPVGIIMGKNRETHKCPLRLRLALLWSVIKLFASKEGRMVYKVFSGVETIDKNLLENSPIKYQGEVSFFAINEDYRGKGLGKRLFQSVQDYMKSENINNFFLFTDTSCNYPFYEHQGMSQRGQHTKTFTTDNYSETLTLFIYDYQIKS